MRSVAEMPVVEVFYAKDIVGEVAKHAMPLLALSIGWEGRSFTSELRKYSDIVAEFEACHGEEREACVYPLDVTHIPRFAPVDLICCEDVLDHYRPRDGRKMIEGMERIVRPFGKLILTTTKHDVGSLHWMLGEGWFSDVFGVPEEGAPSLLELRKHPYDTKTTLALCIKKG